MVTSECVGVELLMLRKSAIVRPVEKEGGERAGAVDEDAYPAMVVFARLQTLTTVTIA